ncbi:hypothetical protein ILYODFUR_030169 [Ilyodon furcidens]|uniref:Uncharacterized protein n=1 Tax=Ilyodon furcidens TaxID=33524 RepID=A0ABV0UCQ1_9TELE
MADGNDDDVIHLASFNVHRSQGSRAGQKELITISDDSDEEPVTFLPGSPVLVPDDADDDDISILELPTPARRNIIRQAAKWSGISCNGGGESSTIATAGDSGCVPSTSRDARINQPAIPAGTATPPVPSSHAQPQPKHHTYTRHRDTTSARSADTPSTSTTAIAMPSGTAAIVQVQPSTSGPSQPPAGSSAHLPERQATTSASATQHTSAVAVVATSSTAKPLETPSTSGRPVTESTQARASLAHVQSHARKQPQPGTSAQIQASGATSTQPQLIQVRMVLPQQPSIQASALITQPQLQHRPTNLLQPLSHNQMQGNLIQIEPQPLAQAPAQPAARPAQTPQVIPVIPPAVLIAAAPERLGPPEAGHRIILGSQAPVEAVPNPPLQAFAVALPAHGHNIRLPNPPVPHNRGEARLILAPNPEQVNPAPALVAVPPAPEAIPQIEDARPGPSAPQERPDQQPHVRALITGVLPTVKRSVDPSVGGQFLPHVEEFKDLGVLFTSDGRWNGRRTDGLGFLL